MRRKSIQEDENTSINWQTQNRKHLFKTLKRGNPNITKCSSKSSDSRENTECYLSESSCENTVYDDLFRRSVCSLSQRSHRTNLISDSQQVNDIYYSNPKKEVKNYRPLKERYMESSENRKKICDFYNKKREMETIDDCPFAPKIVSKQTKQTHDLFNPERKIPVEEKELPLKPVINQKSKEIAENLTNSTTIYERQSYKIYHNPKAPEKEEKKSKKIPKSEMKNLINRLTSQKDEYSSDSEEFEDKYQKMKINKKTIDRLVLDSIQKNQIRNKSKADSKTIELNDTSEKRDMYLDSINDSNQIEKSAIQIQDSQNCIQLPNKGTYSNIECKNEVYLDEACEKERKNKNQPFGAYIVNEINQNRFSFDRNKMNQ